jgi:hydroxymethylpyrimidine/phosphomethylpyrimidine kinase
MHDLAAWLQSLTDQQLREFIDRHLPAMKTAAQAELDNRTPTRTTHGTGCTCCGAGVQQWR